MAGRMVPIKAGGPARTVPRNVSSKPHFPVGARPMNVSGPRINQHPKPLVKSRDYGKAQGDSGGFFGSLGGIEDA